jgi:hypothetical protein
LFIHYIFALELECWISLPVRTLKNLPFLDISR